MRHSLPLILLVAAQLPGAAGAAPWSTVARNAESVVEIDTGGLVRKGQSVKAWSRQIYNDDQDLPLGDPPFRAVRYLYTYECGKRSALLLRRTYVDEQGEAIKDQMLEGLEMAKDVIPGTLQERVYDYACKNAKDPDKVAQKTVQVAKAEPAPAGKDEDAEDAGPESGQDKGQNKGQGSETQSKGAAQDDGQDEAAAKDGGAAKGKAAGHAKTPAKGSAAASKTKAKQGEVAEDEHGEPKRAKPAKVAKAAKSAKDEESDAQGDGGDEEDPAAQAEPKAGKAAKGGKKGRHDLEDACDNCEKADGAPQQEKAAKPDGHGPHWTYEGKEGPQNWAKLSPEFSACGSGKYQSPIDIREGIRLNLEPIKFEYKSSPLRILDNGHTVVVNYGMGSSIIVNGEKYSLVQFHFHKPSEERIEGKSFDMVVHLVHKNMMGQLAVVAVMLRNGAPNPLVQTLWTHLPLQTGKEGMPKNVSINAEQLLPQDRAYYTFLGSLTTPPCTEGVLWMVMKTPMQVSRTQISAFGRLYENNARPIQQANRRLVKESL